MRQITKDSVNAFINGISFKKDNTEIEIKGEEIKFYLHNNLIAFIFDNQLTISSCGWYTTTTKERLNGILEALTYYKIRQIKGVWYIDDNQNPLKEFKDGMTFNI